MASQLLRRAFGGSLNPSSSPATAALAAAARPFSSASEPIVATLFPGDGIGPEIAESVKQIFREADVPIEWEEHYVGDTIDERTNSFLTWESLESVRRNKVGLKGPMATPIGKGHRYLNLTLRNELNLYANVRPWYSLPGYKTRCNIGGGVALAEAVHGSAPDIAGKAAMLKNLQVALNSRRVDEAWESFWCFRSLYGFPEDDSLVQVLITELSSSLDPFFLRKARDLVLLISTEKPGLLHRESLAKLSLSLARAQLPNPAAAVLGLMLEKDMLPSVSVLRAVFLHMVKTEIGTHLVSKFLGRVCESFLEIVLKDRNRAEKMKPDTVMFSLVLDACVRFKLGFKGEQVMELMAKAAIVADAHTIAIICQIHEMSGHRDELKRYKPYIERVSSRFRCHYRPFYNCLLSLHFKFNDIDAAAELVSQICWYHELVPGERSKNMLPKSTHVPIGSRNLKNGLTMQIQPELMQKDTVLRVETKQELVMFRNGKLLFSDKALAKFVLGFKRTGNVGELSNLLLLIQTELCSLRGLTLCCDMIEASIRLGWLGFAHDILDEVEACGASVSSITYMLLLNAYLKGKMLREAKALLNKMAKPGSINSVSKIVITEYLPSVNGRSTSTTILGLINAFVHESIDEKKALPSTVYELNSSIRFFCQAGMIDDAMSSYRRMREAGIEPTVETFTNLVSGFSSLKLYREITILWGDMKRDMVRGNRFMNRDLYEHLLMSFLRGGYFERVMEVVEHMSRNNMFRDKLLYRSEFLKLHKNLYRSLKSSEAKTEAQRDRLRYVLAFRKWIGAD